MLEMNVPSERGDVIARKSSGDLVRLFRNRQQLIEANLAGVKVANQKKQLAQQAYYDDTTSPLKREYSDYKGPVHRRLGKQVILRRNSSQLGRRFLPYNQFGLVRLRRTPHISQQARLSKLREGTISKYYTSNYISSIPPKVLMRQNTRWLERSGAPRNLQYAGHNSQNPLNYTIEIKNNSSTLTPYSFAPSFRHSIRAQLSPSLQEQIRTVQAENVCVNQFPLTMIPTLPGGATNITMNERFSLLD